jgi:hypothetical protein
METQRSVHLNIDLTPAQADVFAQFLYRVSRSGSQTWPELPVDLEERGDVFIVLDQLGDRLNAQGYCGR